MEIKAGLPVIDFTDLPAWEAWLAAQPHDAKGLWLKIAKAGNVESTLTKAQAIDGALCHGWIDGQIDRYDDAWFLTRFTPRKAQSKWSEKNRRRVEELMEDGRVSPAGRAAVESAKGDGRWDAAYAPASTATEPDDLRAALDANPAARAFFDTLTAPIATPSCTASKPRRSPKLAPHGSPNSSPCVRRTKRCTKKVPAQSS